MAEKPKASSSHERMLKGYLTPQLYSKLPELIGKGFTKSEIVNEGVRRIMVEQNIIPVKTK